jgi:hypothetical protein
MVAVRLSQQEQPRHCHGTREIDDGRHICGLLVRAWYQALCQNAAENVVARQRPVGTGAVQHGPHLLLLRAKEMLHPGSRFQMAGDLLETYLLWLIEAHALAPASWAATSQNHQQLPRRTTIRNRKHGRSANRDCRPERDPFVVAVVKRLAGFGEETG